jgi:hypothetical protein
MKSQIAFVLLSLVLASCTPFTANLPKTITPPTELAYPMQVPTPVNTPHAIPTPIGQVTQMKSFDLSDERLSTFKESLEFKIRILDISLDTDVDLTLYIVKSEGTITDISNQPVVITKYLRSGVTVDPEVFWTFSYDGKRLEYIQCCADGWLNINQDSYIVLQPGEFQRYTWAFSLPLALRNSDEQDVSLSQKPITIAATYGNSRVGYTLKNEDGDIIATTDENGEPVFYVVDMNAWVGEVQSDSITYVFP